MAQEEEQTIPSMDDFAEASLLDQVSLYEKEEEEEEVGKEEEEEEKPKAEEEEAEGTPPKEEEEENDEEEDDEEESEDSFWDDVEAITGNKVEVDYGDVDPASPEGAAMREEVVMQKAIEENLEHLSTNYPEAFQVLQHVANGGKIEDLLPKGEEDFTTLEIAEDNVAEQKNFMKNYYMSKGLSEAKAIRNVEDDEDSEEGLYKNFQSAFEERKEAQVAEKAAIVERQEAAKAAQDEQDRKFGEILSGMLNQGKVGSFKIPPKEAEGFYNHVLSHVQRAGNGYTLAIPLSNDNLSQSLEQMFFGYKKGDFSKYIETKAKTQNTKRLKRNLKREKDGAESGSEGREGRPDGSKLPTLGSFEAK